MDILPNVQNENEIMMQLLENQDDLSQSNIVIQQLLNVSFKAQKQQLDQINLLQFQVEGRNQNISRQIKLKDEQNQKLIQENSLIRASSDQTLNEMKILRNQNLQIQTELDVFLRQFETQSICKIVTLLEEKEEELIKLKQSCSTMFETIQDIQIHNEMQMKEISEQKLHNADLNELNRVLLKKLNDQILSQSKLSVEILKYQQQNILLTEQQLSQPKNTVIKYGDLKQQNSDISLVIQQLKLNSTNNIVNDQFESFNFLSSNYGIPLTQQLVTDRQESELQKNLNEVIHILDEEDQILERQRLKQCQNEYQNRNYSNILVNGQVDFQSDVDNIPQQFAQQIITNGLLQASLQQQNKFGGQFDQSIYISDDENEIVEGRQQGPLSIRRLQNSNRELRSKGQENIRSKISQSLYFNINLIKKIKKNSY